MKPPTAPAPMMQIFLMRFSCSRFIANDHAIAQNLNDRGMP
jgi:hypothetical protein